MLLAIDTSTHYASVALHDGERLLDERTWLANQDHTHTLLPTIERLLANAGLAVRDLKAVAIALGPGSFNGLRVGLSTAKGLALAAGLPLIGVPTLEIVAAEYGLAEASLNAGRGRIYRWTERQDARGQSSADGDIQLIEGQAPDRARHAGVLAELAWRRLRAGQLDDPAQLQPIYVQPPHITTSRKVKPLPARGAA